MCLSGSPKIILRGIISELRRTNPKLKPIANTTVVSYLMHEFRLHKVTEKQTCKSPDELQSMAKTYLSYLQSLRQYQELMKQFYAKGERSVEETATLMGFALPETPDSKNQK